MWNWVLPVLGYFAFLGGLIAIEWWRIDRQERREGLKPFNPRRYQEITPEQWEKLEALAVSEDRRKPPPSLSRASTKGILPMRKAVIVAACLVYIISPLDAIPDLPVIGWGDDVVAALIGLLQLTASRK